MEQLNVHGPLDPSDVPVVTSLDLLLPGQAAWVDNGTDAPQWRRKRLDGSVPKTAGEVRLDALELLPGRAYDAERRLRATLVGNVLAPLRRFAGKVRRGETVSVLLVGSSSFTQTGASTPAAAFEPQFTAGLRAAFPGVTINVTNKGVGGWRLPNLEGDIQTYVDLRPDLILVMVGVNDGIQQTPGLDEFRLRYESFCRVLARNGSDIIAIDGQMWQAEQPINLRYNQAIRDAATAAGVAFFSRRDMMQQAINRGEYTLAQLKDVGGTDLHDNNTGYALWATSMVAAIASGVKEHGDESRVHRAEFSAEQPTTTVPAVNHLVYRTGTSTVDVEYDRWSIAANQVVVLSLLFRGSGVRWLPFLGVLHNNLAQVRYRIDEGTWATLPRPIADGNLRGGSWTLARNLLDVLHLVEVELTAGTSGLDFFQSGFEVLVPGDTAAIGSSLALGGRTLVAQGAKVTAGSGLNVNVGTGMLLLQGRLTGARVADAAGLNVAIAAANAAQPRIDLVYHSWDGVRVLQGTPAASPVAPTMPHEAVALAEVLVPAGATAVGAITDRRLRPTVPGTPAPRVGTRALVPQVNRAASAGDSFTIVPVTSLDNTVGNWSSTLTDGWIKLPKDGYYTLSVTYVLSCSGAQNYNIVVFSSTDGEKMKVAEGYTQGGAVGSTAAGLIVGRAGEQVRLGFRTGGDAYMYGSALTYMVIRQEAD